MPPADPALAQWFANEVQPHEQELRAYLHRKFSPQLEVDDLVQETYARLLKAHSLTPIKAPRAYLFTTARNIAKDFFRRSKVVPIDPVADPDVLPVFEDRAGIVEAVCSSQEIQMLAEGIQALPDRCRQIVTLRKLHGLSHREIGEQLGIAENTVNAQMAIGVIRLRDYLKSRGMLSTGRA